MDTIRSVAKRFTSLNPGFCGSCRDKFTWERITQPKNGRFSSMEIRDIVRRGEEGCPFCKLIADSMPMYMAKYAKDTQKQLGLNQGIKISFHMKVEQGSLDTIIVKMKDELPGSAWQDAFQLKIFASESMRSKFYSHNVSFAVDQYNLTSLQMTPRHSSFHCDLWNRTLPLRVSFLEPAPCSRNARMPTSSVGYLVPQDFPPE